MKWLLNYNRNLFIRLSVLGFVFILTGCGNQEPFYGNEVTYYMPASDFTLTDQFGQPFRLNDHKGKVILLFFGYTFCPDVCPATLSTWQEAYPGLGPDTSQVVFVYITVDPERDVPERLAHYLDSFSVPVYGLSGAPDQLEKVYAAYNVYREREEMKGSAVGYLYSHTASVLVIDKSGRWRLRIPYGTTADKLVHDLKLLCE